MEKIIWYIGDDILLLKKNIKKTINNKDEKK